MESCTTELFVCVHSKVKPSVKNNIYNNVIVKFIRESEGIIATACTCSAGSSVKCLGKCNHVGPMLFALEDFNRKKLKNFFRTFDIYISVINMKCSTRLFN